MTANPAFWAASQSPVSSGAVRAHDSEPSASSFRSGSLAIVGFRHYIPFSRNVEFIVTFK